MTSQAMVDKLLADPGFTKRYIGCFSCHNSGTFDHGSGNGTIKECIYDDPKKHRYCQCQVCGGTGVDPDRAAAFKASVLAVLKA